MVGHKMIRVHGSWPEVFHDNVDLFGESDRAVVLVVTNDIEQGLRALFTTLSRRRLTKELEKEVFDFNGPLGTLSSKIKLAYVLGLLGKQTYQDLQRLRKLRNEVAHGSHDFRLHDPRVMTIIEQFNTFKYAAQNVPEALLVDFDEELLRADRKFASVAKYSFLLAVLFIEAEIKRQRQMLELFTPFDAKDPS